MKYLLIIIVSFGFLACSQVEKSNKLINKSIILKITGEAKVQPNEAFVNVYLKCINKNIAKSKTCLIKQSEELKKLFKSYKIKQEDIVTNNIAQSKEYRWHKNTYKFDGYKSATSMSIHIKNLTVLEQLYTKLLINKQIEIGNLSFTHSNLDSLNNAAYLNALDKANIIADKLLKSTQATKKEVISIKNINIASTPPIYDQNKLLETENNIDKAKEVKEKTVSIYNGTMQAQESLIIEYHIN